MSAAPLLSVRDLSVDITRDGETVHAVRHVSFDIRPGEALGIAGESGCGKSMTTLALLGLLPRGARRSAREITFQGVPLLGLDRQAMGEILGAEIATIFQDPTTSLNPVFTIGSQLAEVYTRHRVGGRAAARRRAVDLLTQVGVRAAADRLDQFPHQLSGGLRQRVMIAMALMCGPKLLIADEPTTALDVTVQADVLRLVRSFQNDMGLAVLFVSHDLGVMANVTDRMVVMYAGEIVESGPTARVLREPAHPYTAALLRCRPAPGRNSRSSRLETIPGRVPRLTGLLEGCQFRNRCPIAAEACAVEAPALSSAGPECAVRCLRREPGRNDSHARYLAEPTP